MSKHQDIKNAKAVEQKPERPNDVRLLREEVQVIRQVSSWMQWLVAPRACPKTCLNQRTSAMGGRALPVWGWALCGLVGLAGCTIGVPVDAPDEGDGINANLVVFFDPDSEFSTTDVRDVNEEIVRFDGTTKAIIWVADDLVFDEGAWETDGNFLGAGRRFQVRFGTVDGERRAYFTETGPATICDISVEQGQLRIAATNVLVPQE